jgi:hypothetical protein
VRHAARSSVWAGSALFAFIVLATVLILPNFNFFGRDGLLPGINGLFQILPGFYVAALAAIAVFDGRPRGYDLDSAWNDAPPTLSQIGDNDKIITRRHFLALMFGYLAFSSLILYLIGIFALSIAEYGDIINEFISFYVKVLFIFIYNIWLGHIIGTTWLGLYFLSHRFHV